MYPVLFSPDATAWDSFGIGVLSDSVSCEVEEKRNGSYELEMTYPITGAFFDQLALRCLVVAKPNYTDPPQPFRIYNISKPLNGIVTISAQHISYDLSGYIDAPFTALGIQTAIQQMTSDSIVYPTGCPFTISSTNQSGSRMTVNHPASVRALMGGTQGSLLDVYGGEWHFDGYSCEFNPARGADRGVVIRYGKNLTDLNQEENNEKVYTAVYPYYYNQEADALVVLPEKIIAVPGTFSFTRIMPLDMSNEFEEIPTEEDLRDAAEGYIESNSIGVPDVNLTISFIEDDSLRDRVDLCDTVQVVFEQLGVSATAKCIRTKWDVLKGRYIEAELGNAKSSFVSAIVGSHEMAETLEKYSSQLNAIAYGIISKVTGNVGGYIVMHDTNNDGEPDEILIMDSDDITQAVNIIRMNRAGIAFSKTGYTGQYITAWNINGDFVANFIASGELQTDRVTILGDTQFYWDNANITLVDPNNINRMIRFGQYDGTNYGLGFSVDGGHTWKSGFTFDGIKMIGDAENAGYVKMDGDAFDILNASGVSLCHLGIGTVIGEDGTIKQGPYYRLGTYSTGSSHGEYSFSAGRFSHPNGPHSICVGYNNTSNGLGSIALGKNCSSADEAGISIGKNCESSGTSAVAMGNQAIASATSAIAIGSGSATYSGAIAIGSAAKGHNSSAVGVGDLAEATGSASTAIGFSAESQGKYATAIGYLSKANGERSSAFGYEAVTSAIYATAIGPSATASGKSSFARGAGAAASGEWACASGNNCVSSAKHSFSFGNYCTADQDGQFVFGQFNASTTAQFVFGSGQALNQRGNSATLTSAGVMWVAGSYTQGSDGRYKNRTGDAPDLSSVRAIRFRWKDDGKHDQQEHVGYIAQDVEQLAPYLVQTDEATGFKSLDYIGLLCAKVEQLEQTVERLTKRVAELEAITSEQADDHR